MFSFTEIPTVKMIARNERTPMVGPPEGPPLWYECGAWAPTGQAGGDRGAPMAGPPEGPSSRHEEDEAPMASPPEEPQSRREEDEALVAAPPPPRGRHCLMERVPGGRPGKRGTKRGDPHLVESMERGQLPVRAVLPHPETIGAAAGRDEGHFHPAPFQIVRSALIK